jgi:hypothetical protein
VKIRFVSAKTVGWEGRLPGRVIAIESALDGWVRVMMRQSVTVRGTTGLAVAMAVRLAPQSTQVASLLIYPFPLVASHFGRSTAPHCLSKLVHCVPHSYGTD